MADEGDKLAIFAGCLGITLHKNKIWITELSHHISESDHIYYVGPCGWDPFWTLSRADVTIYQDRRTTLYQILKYTYTYVRNTVSTKARTRSRGRTLFSIENPPLRSAPARAADGRTPDDGCAPPRPRPLWQPSRDNRRIPVFAEDADNALARAR